VPGHTFLESGTVIASNNGNWEVSRNKRYNLQNPTNTSIWGFPIILNDNDFVLRYIDPDWLSAEQAFNTGSSNSVDIRSLLPNAKKGINEFNAIPSRQNKSPATKYIQMTAREWTDLHFVATHDATPNWAHGNATVNIIPNTKSKRQIRAEAVTYAATRTITV